MTAHARREANTTFFIIRDSSFKFVKLMPAPRSPGFKMILAACVEYIAVAARTVARHMTLIIGSAPPGGKLSSNLDQNMSE
jgi:hypothetical protein